MFKTQLEGANLFKARFDENTVLPNGNKWSPETDLRTFGVILTEPKWWQNEIESMRQMIEAQGHVRSAVVPVELQNDKSQ
jgi:hypothetical protein